MKEKENRYGAKSAKRVLAVALAVLMLMTLLPAAAFAAATAPVITAQPQSVDITEAGDATFSVTADGAESYQWYGHGLLSTATLISAEPADGKWTQSNDVWQSQIQGQKYATATLTAVFDVTEGQIIAFDWKVSSESGYDKLSYSLASTTAPGIKYGNISGEDVDFATVSLENLEPDTYTLTVTYEKDGSADSGEDCGWVSFYGMVPLTGKTENTMTVEAADPNYLEGRGFYCVVSNAEGTTKSNTAYLAKPYTVSFNLNYADALPGGSQTVLTFGTATEPNKPVREGYTFLGWCVDAAGTALYDFTAPITGDVTIYAAWLKSLAGSGTAASPYLLNSSEDVLIMLQGFAADETYGTEAYLSAHYKLEANITLPAGFVWENEFEFGGVLDGNGKTLDGLKTEVMFESIGTGGTVKNLALGSNCLFSVAAFAGYNNGTIENCINNGAVTAEEAAAGIVLENGGTVTGCTNKGIITAAYPFAIVAKGTEGENCTNDGQLIVETIPISGYTLSDGVMAFSEANPVDVKGLYKGQYLSTTFSDDGYELAYDPDAFTVEARPSFVNKNSYVKLEYKLTAIEDVIDGKFAIHTDVQIGENDDAPISLLYDADGKAIGLKMVDNDKNSLTRGAQFNLFFRGTHGVTNVSSYWFGEYDNRGDNLYNTIADQLGKPTEANGWTKDGETGQWTKEHENGDYSYSTADGLQLTGTDSGLAVSWQGIELKRGQTTIVSILLGIGSADMEPPVAQNLTYSESSNKASFTVKDTEATWDNNTIQNGSTIWYSLDGGKETEVSGAVVTKVDEEKNTYTYTFALPSLSEGFHTISVWAMNDAGMLSGTKTLNISRWSVPTYTVTGKIEMPQPDEDAERPTVTLKKGGDVYSQAVTDENGEYTFEKVPAGVYNIVIETPEGRTLTKQVEVTADETKLADIAIPDGNKNTVVEVKPGTPPVVADGLNELYDNTALADDSKPEESVTQADLDVITGGGSVELKLTVDSLEEGSTADSESIKNEARDKTVGLYLDIAIKKIVKDSTGGILENQSAVLSEIPSLITLRMTLPETHRGHKDYVVYRMHEGQVDALTETPNINGEYFELAGNDLILHVNRFSTYALAYTAATPPSGGVIPAPKPEIAEPKNGTVKVVPETPIIGGRVTVIPTPDEGYKVGKVTVTDQNGNKITVTPTENGSFSFVQPLGKVTIAVSFIRAGELPFTDVAKSDWFYDNVKYVYENGLMCGTSDTIFSPYLNTDRGMIITILWRLEGEPKAEKAAGFTDVLPGQYYTDACAWGAEKGIALGYGDGRYGPADPITREQLASILWRYAKYKGYDVSAGEDTDILGFKDAGEINEYAIPALKWAYGVGIIAGRGDGILDPQGHALRAETAAMLTRLLSKNA